MIKLFGSFLLTILAIFWAGPAMCADFTNDIGMEFVKIPAGKFIMGENPHLNNHGKADEHPYHEVAITKPYYIGATEVAQEQWQKVMNSNPSQHIGPKNPVDSVSWNDAQEFIKRLNLLDSPRRYRLPTEAEWEYAARAGSPDSYHFGNDATKLPEYAWITANANGTTHPVASKKPNAFGLYDTSGNVREWVNDWYDAGYYAKSPANDPAGPASGQGRAYRGGSKDGAEFPTRSSYRWRETPDTKSQNLGFRVVLDDIS